VAGARAIDAMPGDRGGRRRSSYAGRAASCRLSEDRGKSCRPQRELALMAETCRAQPCTLEEPTPSVKPLKIDAFLGCERGPAISGRGYRENIRGLTVVGRRGGHSGILSAGRN